MSEEDTKFLVVDENSKRSIRVASASHAATVGSNGDRFWEMSCVYDPSEEFWNLTFTFDQLAKDALVDDIAFAVFNEVIGKRCDADLAFSPPKIDMTTDHQLVVDYDGDFEGQEELVGYGVVVEGSKYIVAHKQNAYLAIEGTPEQYIEKYGHPPTAFTDVKFINPVNSILHGLFFGVKRLLQKQAVEVSRSLVTRINEITPLENNQLNSELVALNAKIDNLANLIESREATREDVKDVAYYLRRFLDKFTDSVAEQIGKRFVDGLLYLGSLLLWLLAMM